MLITMIIMGTQIIIIIIIIIMVTTLTTTISTPIMKIGVIVN